MRPLLLVVVVLGFGGDAQAQNSRELWRRDLVSEITLQRVLPSGDLLVSTDSRTMVLAPDTGEVKWQRDDITACGTRMDRGPTPTCRVGKKREYMSSFGSYLRFETALPEGTPSNFLNQQCRADRACIEANVLRGAAKKGIGMSFKPTHDNGRLLFVDVATGTNVFDSGASGFPGVDGTCLLARESTLIVWGERERQPALAVAFDLTAGQIRWTRDLPLVRDMQCLPFDGAGLVLVNGRGEGNKPRTFAIDAQTGMSRWESVELSEKEWKLPVALTEMSTALLHVNASGPMQVDLQKGTILWRSDPFGGAEPVGDVNGRILRPQPIVRAGDQYYLTLKERLAALSVTGSIVWTRTFNESPVIVADTPLGLLTRAHAGRGTILLELLRPENGQTRWSAVVSGMGGWLLTPDNLVHVTGNKVHRLSLATGESLALGDAAFASSDPPVELSWIDDAVVVTSSEHLAAYSQSGGARYEVHMPAPGMSATEQMLAIALAGVRTTASQAAARSLARNAANTAAYVRGGSATVYYFYSVYQPNLDVRFASATDADLYAYMFTARADAPGFRVVRLDKRKGADTGWVPFVDRRPRYAIDPVSGRVFSRTKDSEITAYTF